MLSVDAPGSSVSDSVDESILQHMINTGAEFIMEVTDKTKADIKVRHIQLRVSSLELIVGLQGGTLVEYDGSIRLLEVAQVASEHIEDFKSGTSILVLSILDKAKF